MSRLSSHRRWLASWLAVLFITVAATSSRADTLDEVSAKALVKRMSDYLGEQPRYQCKLTAVVSIESPNLSNKMETITDLRIDRPDRVASELRTGMNGITMISDGKSVTTYMPSMKTYTVEKTSRSIDQVFNPETSRALMMSGPMGQFTPVGGESYYETIMKGVLNANHVATESIDGATCDRLHFDQPGFSWDLWITQGDQPLPVKFMMNMPPEATQGNPMLKDAKLEFYTLVGDWDFDPKFTDADFQFEPPAEATKVDDLFEQLGGGIDDDEELHALLGEAPPQFKTETLEGNSFDLSNRSDDEILILDFWATWCGPCVQALPKLVDVAESFEGQGVRLFAINVGEDHDTIKTFLKESEISVDVLMDEEGEISDLYQANAIPQTVIIGRDGVIQVVHVGASLNLESKLTAEIQSLLDGEDLATAAKEKAAKSLADGADTKGLERRWTIRGRFEDAAATPDGKHLYLLGRGGKIDRYEASDDRETMSKQMTVNANSGRLLRLARLQKLNADANDRDFDFVTFDPWGGSVVATSSTGTTLWEHAGGSGVDDAWPADIDGDEIDEVIVGYNGGTGIRVLDSAGEIIWKNDEIGNVWHVDAVDLDQDGTVETVSTSAQGAVHVFDQKGEMLRTMKLSLYGNMIRTMPGSKDEKPMIFVAGSADDGEELVAIDATGNEQFSVALPDNGVHHVDAMNVDAETGWVAVAMRGGMVHVVDANEGKIIATANQPTRSTDIAWQVRPDQTPLLVICWNGSVDAYEVTPNESESKTIDAVDVDKKK